MRAKAEIVESIKKTSLILSEMIKGTSYEKEFNALNSFSNEELTVKVESLILKTKFMIKNTKPNVDYASINKLFQFTEENLNFIKKNPLENVKEYNFLFQSSYKEALCMFLTNEGLCNRVQNKRIDEQINALKVLAGHFQDLKKPVSEISENPLTLKQLEILQLYSDGYKTKEEIAKKLKIKEASVISREKSITRKLGTITIPQSIKIATQRGLIK